MIPSSDHEAVPGIGSIHTWTVSLDDPALDLPELLSSDEMSRFSRINHPGARTDFLRSRTSLRLILAKYLRCSGSDIIFSYNENGKPELATETAGPVRFNLSHSGKRCLVAVTTKSDVGVDIERFQAGRDHAALAERFFTANEHNLLASSMDELLFYRMWVLKEASVKSRGMKLLAGLDRFECSMDEGGSLDIIDKQENPSSMERGANCSWSVRQWQPDEDSMAAVVVRCPHAEFIEKALTA